MNASDAKVVTEGKALLVRPTNNFSQTYSPKMRTSNNRSQIDLPTARSLIRCACQPIVTYIPHFTTVATLSGQAASRSSSLCDILNFSLIPCILCPNMFINSMLPSTYNSRSSLTVKDRHLQAQSKKLYKLLRDRNLSRSLECKG
jgi:hypothetical protein